MGGDLIPDLERVKHGILNYGVVWLMVGSYKYEAKTDTYFRLGGHWVILVGYGQNRRGQADPYSLIIHNSNLSTGRNFRNDYIRAELIRSGKLVGKYSGLPMNVGGFYRLTGDIRITKRGANTAIMDGAVIL